MFSRHGFQIFPYTGCDFIIIIIIIIIYNVLRIIAKSSGPTTRRTQDVSSSLRGLMLVPRAGPLHRQLFTSRQT